MLCPRLRQLALQLEREEKRGRDIMIARKRRSKNNSEKIGKHRMDEVRIYLHQDSVNLEEK